MSELPGCLLEWEKDLRRCQQEGRKCPDDEVKRLTLLKMLPPKQRATVWANANQLYPTFQTMWAKIQEMITDSFDSKDSPMAMDIDNVDGEGDWAATGQTLVGTNAHGEEELFSLQKKETHLG